MNGVTVNGGVLNITAASTDMAGTYRVAANNSEGGAVTEFKLDILYSPRYDFFFINNTKIKGARG